jgi:hypothetical protein
MKYDCDGCKQPLSTWDYRYHGHHYCRPCYDRLFKINTCSICGKSKKIFIDLAVPVCKICQVKDKPCIRCGKTEYTPGKITSYGPVCNSCSKYFREYRTCSTCGRTSSSVSNRTLLDGHQKVLCQLCYNKTLPICYRCHKQRKADAFDENGHPICHICAHEGERECTQCGVSFPAGKGRICSDCTYQNSYRRRLTFGRNTLSVHMSELFVMFGAWLAERRGIQYAVVSIPRYLKYFARLDHLAREIERIPNYTEMVEHLTVQETRANLLVTVFLDQTGAIPINRVIQEEYSNLDMIDRYLDRFEEWTWARTVLEKYLAYLQVKLESNQTTIHSIRLSIGAAANLMSYSKELSEDVLTNNGLDGYLWKYPGQRSTLSGFVVFLQRTYHLPLKLPNKDFPILKAPIIGRIQLKQQLIDMLRRRGEGKIYENELMKIAIEYLHGVRIPDNVLLQKKDCKTDNVDTVIKLARQEFYIPKEISE